MDPKRRDRETRRGFGRWRSSSSSDDEDRPLFNARSLRPEELAELLEARREREAAAGLSSEGLNSADFDWAAAGARFFVVKAKSEYDVHEALKTKEYYSQSLNKRLGEDPRLAGPPDARPGPVFLFFSVNCSGQFCAVAQVTSVRAPMGAAVGNATGATRCSLARGRSRPRGRTNLE